MATFLHRTTKQLAPDNGTGDLGAAWIRNPDLSAVDGVASLYWIIEGDTVRPATGGEIAAIDAQAAIDAANAASALLAAQRAAASDAIASLREESYMIDRATLLLMLSEINLLRATFATLKSGTANAGTFAAFKTVVSGLNSNTQRTIQQLRTAVRNNIESGSADS